MTQRITLPFLLFGAAIFGQSVPMLTVPGPPTGAPEPNIPPSVQAQMPDVAGFTLPRLDIHGILAKPLSGGRHTPIAQHRPLPAAATGAGVWAKTPAGHALWRLRISDTGALGLRLHFTNFGTGSGRVWVHNGLQVLGPFTRRGVFDDGDFWTGFVFGDSLVIEYESTGGAALAELPFTIEGVTHLWEFMGQKSPAAAAAVDTSCMLDAVCYTSDSQVADAFRTVVFLLIPQGGNEFAACSGTMVNDRNSTSTPFLLTAGHCITSNADARAVTVFWNYQTAVCNGSTPDFTALPSVTGATLLDQNQQPAGLDYAFVQLSGRPGVGWFSAGWSTAEVNVNDTLVSVSHPRALPKRYANLSRNVQSTDYPLDSYLFLTSVGKVDHGSSGSALFSVGAQVRATLSTASNPESVSACTVSPQYTAWTKFSSIYSNVKAWLEDQATQVPNTAAVMQTPTPGSTLPGSSVTLSWSYTTASEYFIYAGTSVGAKDLINQNVGSQNSYTAAGLPTDGSKIYIRLWSHLSDGWYSNDYVYTAASIGGPAQMISPAAGSTFGGSTATFTWSKSGSASEYFLYIGTSVGAKDIYSQNTGLATTWTVTGLPTNGGKLYVRLWTHLSDGWYSNDYGYQAASVGGPAQMLSPAPGSTVAISPLVFSWTKSPAASGYFLHIGTTLGGKELFSQDVGNVTAYSITGLSTSSKTIYVRLWTHLDYWYSNDYAYTVTSTAAPATGNLTITFTPSAVTRDTSDNKFHYSVTLRETNGVGVTVTGMFIAGADYTSSIVDWFGSDAIGASGSAIVYVVSACAASPCNENRMWTFTGRDANGHTGLSWSAAVALGQ